MNTVFSVIVCVGLLAMLAYVLFLCVYEIGLAIYRRLPLETRMRIDDLVEGKTRKVA